jgi:hypothetical protein
MPGRYLVASRGDACGVLQPLKFAELAALHQRDDHAGGPGAGRPARAVQVVLVVVRRVELHDQVDVVHVDAAGGKRAPDLSSPDLIRDSIQSATRTYTGVGGFRSWAWRPFL